MRSVLKFSFPTFVLQFLLWMTLLGVFAPLKSHAAKSSGASIYGDDAETPPATEGEKDMRRETVDVVIPPGGLATPKSTEYFFPYRSSLGFRLGSSVRTATYNDMPNPIQAGVLFSFTLPNLTKYEATADLYSDGTGSLGGSRKWVFGRSKLRPFLRGGVGIIINPKDQLAALAKYDQVMAVGSAGAEYLVRKTQSVRVEFEAGVGIKCMQVLASAGYVWAW